MSHTPAESNARQTDRQTHPATDADPGFGIRNEEGGSSTQVQVNWLWHQKVIQLVAFPRKISARSDQMMQKKQKPNFGFQVLLVERFVPWKSLIGWGGSPPAHCTTLVIIEHTALGISSFAFLYLSFLVQLCSALSTPAACIILLNFPMFFHLIKLQHKGPLESFIWHLGWTIQTQAIADQLKLQQTANRSVKYSLSGFNHNWTWQDKLSGMTSWECNTTCCWTMKHHR